MKIQFSRASEKIWSHFFSRFFEIETLVNAWEELTKEEEGREGATHQGGGGGAAAFSEATSSGHPEQEEIYFSFSFPAKDLNFPESNLNLIPSMGVLRCGRD